MFYLFYDQQKKQNILIRYGRALYLYFLGLSTRGVAKQCSFYTRLREVTSQSGIGLKNVILERYPQKERKWRNTSSMRP
ncbi:MAG: hypothetical protein M3Q77_07095 [Thermoproteota archaeon]|nr:hypothetical protein [Thermoproteota archaeon]